MDHYALRKYRGPATWALVRDAYLAGEPAPIVAQRYNVSLANLRRKALREGWTRRAYATATDRAPQAERTLAPPPPSAPSLEAAEPPSADAAALKAAVQSALGRAACDLAAGRSAEALAALKAVEALQRLSAALAPEALDLSDAEEEAQDRAAMAELRDRAIAMAESLALAALCDTPRGVPAVFTPWLYRWRAAHLGEEAARADFLNALSDGVASDLWDEEGRLRPPRPPAPLKPGPPTSTPKSATGARSAAKKRRTSGRSEP